MPLKRKQLNKDACLGNVFSENASVISLEKECKRDLVGDFVQEGLCSCCKIHRGGGGGRLCQTHQGDYAHIAKNMGMGD